METPEVVCQRGALQKGQRGRREHGGDGTDPRIKPEA